MARIARYPPNPGSQSGWMFQVCHLRSRRDRPRSVSPGHANRTRKSTSYSASQWQCNVSKHVQLQNDWSALWPSMAFQVASCTV